MNWWQRLDIWLENFLLNFIPDPETDPKTLPMNAPDDNYEGPRADAILVVASDALAQTAWNFLGKDASPLNRAPQELSCAEGVVNIINTTWPGTLRETIVGTDVLYEEMKRSPRFKGVLEPVIGCIEISPRTMTTNGHVGIYTDSDRIASNDSKTGKFNKNYTRQSWRDVFIKGRGLKAYLFQPVDIAIAEDPHERDN